MKYISHIKELVSGIIVNDLVTRDTEAYNALTALKNHLESLEEVYKYMPYKDPGPVIQNLEEGLTHRNSEIQNLKAEVEDLKEDIKQKDSYIENLKKQTSDAQCDLDTWINYKGPDFEDQINKLEEETKILRSLLNEEQFTQYREQTKCLSDPYHKTLYDQERDKVGFLLRLLTQEQEEEFQEYLRTQLPDDQPQHHQSPKPNRKKRRITDQ
jgi:vacuolar-type H+-ATPase subunit I/STV1